MQGRIRTHRPAPDHPAGGRGRVDEIRAHDYRLAESATQAVNGGKPLDKRLPCVDGGTAIEEGRDLSSIATPADGSIVCSWPDGPASLQVPGEEPVRLLPGVLRDAGMPAHIGVQRLLLGAEGVEQVQGHLPVVSFVVPLQQDV